MHDVKHETNVITF